MCSGKVPRGISSDAGTVAELSDELFLMDDSMGDINSVATTFDPEKAELILTAQPGYETTVSAEAMKRALRAVSFRTESPH